MEVRWMKDGRTKEWTCCGRVWQLTMSRLFPDRISWSPVCPDCGEEGSPYPRAFRGYHHGIAEAVLRSVGVE